MTVLCAIRDATGCWIASDQQVSVTNGDWLSRTTPKWIVAGKSALGGTGSSALFSIVRGHAAEIVDTWEPLDLQRWARDLLQRYGAKGKVDSESDAPWWDLSFLWARPDALFHLGPSYASHEIPIGQPIAKGSGVDYATGAMWALQPQLSGGALVTIGIRAALEFDSGCGGEPWIRRIGEASP